MEAELKEKGWEKILSAYEDDPDPNLSAYRDLARDWSTCAFGELMNFPPQWISRKMGNIVPSYINSIGYAFTDAVSDNDPKQALECLEAAKEYTKEIREIRDYILLRE